MSPTRASEFVRCRGALQADQPARSQWQPSAPRVRNERLQPSGPRWPVCEFAESDYCYGVGPIRIRPVRVDWSRPVPHEGDLWFEVHGVVIDRSGREGAMREMLIRAGRVPVPPASKRPRLRALRSSPV